MLHSSSVSLSLRLVLMHKTCFYLYIYIQNKEIHIPYIHIRSVKCAYIYKVHNDNSALNVCVLALRSSLSDFGACPNEATNIRRNKTWQIAGNLISMNHDWTWVVLWFVLESTRLTFEPYPIKPPQALRYGLVLARHGLRLQFRPRALDGKMKIFSWTCKCLVLKTQP